MKMATSVNNVSMECNKNQMVSNIRYAEKEDLTLV